MGRNDAAIRRCWQEWADNGRFHDHDGRGRPRVTSDREDRLIVRPSVTAPDSSLSTIRRATRTRVSTMTIHRRLIELNLRSCRPLHHLPLTPAHCRVRLQWYLDQSGVDHAEWGRIVFCDKSHFQLYPKDNRRRVWRRARQCADPYFTIARPTGPQPGVMVKGVILLTAGPLWSSLKAHLQCSGTSTTF
ncbi:HTH_Tnp_Tc3_2 domain-containing protein [Trichonephila clavipes]|uniref:HTH_Tnp_Tc3_2 domain-containing protein n=1 Tax=Trichonephila clavipes TaxID=2585209 RepID=A0A8X6SRN1_TRICX|nr:HTH_Tnp_Tc3_2 domain-containing protein [Trichonephila clavipes]